MKKAFFFLAIIASILIINNLVRSIYDLWQKKDLVATAEKRLEEAKKQNKELKTKLEEVKSKDFIEEEVRNKLFMARPQESEVIISKDLLKSPKSSNQPQEEEQPNWRKWWELFFK